MFDENEFDPNRSKVEVDLVEEAIRTRDDLAPSSFTVEDILNRSWEILRSCGPQIIFTLWFGIFLGFVPMLLSLLLTIDQRVPGRQPGRGIRILDFVALGLSMLVFAGTTLFVTNVASGRKAAFGDLFRCRKFAGPILLAYFLMALAGVGIQFLLIFATMILGEVIGDFAILVGFFVGVPVFYAITISLTQVPFLIVDRETSAFGALKLSWALMRGHRVQYLFLTFCCFVINVIGLLAFGVGLLVTVPLNMLCLAVFYLALSGQPVADPYGWSRDGENSSVSR